MCRYRVPAAAVPASVLQHYNATEFDGDFWKARCAAIQGVSSAVGAEALKVLETKVKGLPTMPDAAARKRMLPEDVTTLLNDRLSTLTAYVNDVRADGGMEVDVKSAAAVDLRGGTNKPITHFFAVADGATTGHRIQKTVTAGADGGGASSVTPAQQPKRKSEGGSSGDKGGGKKPRT